MNLLVLFPSIAAVRAASISLLFFYCDFPALSSLWILTFVPLSLQRIQCYYIHSPSCSKKNHTTGKIFTLKNNKHWHSISVAPFSTLVMRMLDNRFLQMNINHSTRIRGSSQRNGTQIIIVEDNERRRAKQLPQLIFLRMLFRLPSLIISVFGDFQIFRISENNFFYLYYKPPSSFRKIFH